MALCDGLTVLLLWMAGCSYLFRTELYKLILAGPKWFYEFLGGMLGVGPVLDAVPWLLAALGIASLGHTCLWRLGIRHIPRAWQLEPLGPEPFTWWAMGGLLALIAGGVALRLVQITTALDYDELVTTHFFVNAPSLLDAISRQVVFNNHPAYTVLARLSTGVLGMSELAVRLPALALGCLAVPATWWAARTVLGDRAALATAAAIAFHPLHIYYSQNARGYTGVALCTVLALALLDRTLRTGSRWSAVGFAVSAACGAWFHLYGLWVLLVTWTYVAGVVMSATLGGVSARVRASGDGFRAIWPALALSTAGVVLAYSPMAPSPFFAILGRRHGTTGAAFAAEVWLGLMGRSQWGAIAGAATVLSFAGLCRTRQVRPLLLAALLALPLGVVIVSRPTDAFVRFFSYWIPCVALLFGAAISSVPKASRANRVLAGAAALALLAVVGAWGLAGMSPSPRSAQTRDAARYALSLSAGRPVCAVGDAVVLSPYLGDRLVQVKSIEEFAPASTPSCVVWDVPWLSPAERGIVDHLVRVGRRRDFETLAVFHFGQ